jgi:hypothetical protein
MVANAIVQFLHHFRGSTLLRGGGEQTDGRLLERFVVPPSPCQDSPLRRNVRSEVVSAVLIAASSKRGGTER